MLTRCPACQTVFRVSEEQIALRQGRVRCGHCLNAFDALHNAVEGSPPEEPPEGAEPEGLEQAASPPGALAAAPEAAQEVPPEEAPDAGPLDTELPAVFRNRGQTTDASRPQDEGEAAEPAVPPPGAVSGEPGPPLEPAEAAETASPADSGEESATPAAGAGAPIAAAMLARSDPAEDNENYVRAAGIPVPPPALAVPKRSDPRRAWGIAVGGLAMALAVQGVFLLRQPLTQAFPALRGPLAALCLRLGCELPLPREAAEIGIETSDLHPEPGGQGDFVLHATLKNRAPFPQAYPYVELSLTDAADKPLVRRVFAPAEWSPGTAPDAPFPAGATSNVMLPFNAAGVAAVGYRVYAFYP